MTVSEINTKLMGLVVNERKLTREILKYIADFYKYQGYLKLGYSSIIHYLTKHLGYSDDQAYRRWKAAKLLLQVPEASEQMAKGELNLSQAAKAQSAFESAEKQLSVPLTKEAKQQILIELSNKSNFATEKTLAESLSIPPETRDRVKPQSDKTVRLEVQLTEGQYEKLLQVKSLLSHQCPEQKTGDILETLFDFYINRKQGIKADFGHKKTKLDRNATEAQIDSANLQYKKTEAQGDNTNLRGKKTEVRIDTAGLRSNQTHVQDSTTVLRDNNTEVQTSNTDLQDNRVQLRNNKTENQSQSTTPSGDTQKQQKSKSNRFCSTQFVKREVTERKNNQTRTDLTNVTAAMTHGFRFSRKNGTNNGLHLSGIKNKLDKGCGPQNGPHIGNTKSGASAQKVSRYISVSIKRAILTRSKGCCEFIADNGQRCGSRFQLEFDHIVPVAFGGQSTLLNLRYYCANHNAFVARNQGIGFETTSHFKM